MLRICNLLKHAGRQVQDADLAAGLMLLLAALLDPASAAAVNTAAEHVARLDELALTIAGAGLQGGLHTVDTVAHFMCRCGP